MATSLPLVFYIKKEEKDMWIKLDLDGIDFYLRINSYEKSTENLYDHWCTVELTLESPDWLHHVISSDILLSFEVEEIRDIIRELLKGKHIQAEKITFVEPDLSFHIYPSETKEHADVYLRIHLWNGYLTKNYISVHFDSLNLEKLYYYLQFITGEITKENDIIHQLIEADILRP